MPLYIQLASDNFQRANETPLFGGGNWDVTVNGGTGNNVQLVVFSNACRLRRTIFNTGQFWSTAGGPGSVVFPPDQFAETTVSILPITNGYFIGALVRGANDGNAHLNGYSFHVIRSSATASEYRIVKWVSSGLTTLASITGMPTIALGDVVRIEIQGTTITGFYNGVQKLQVVDSTYSSGQPGIVMFGAVDATPGSKNWDAGSVTGNDLNHFVDAWIQPGSHLVDAYIQALQSDSHFVDALIAIDKTHFADVYVASENSLSHSVDCFVVSTPLSHSVDCYVYSTKRGLIEATLFVGTRVGGALLVETKVGRTLPVETVVGLEPLVVTRKIGKTLPVSTRVGGTFLVE